MINVIPPNMIESNQFDQIIKLILSGKQVNPIGLKERLLRCDLVAFKTYEEKVISTAALKNPSLTYMNKVFALSKTKTSICYEKELGYIATHSNFENQGHCQDLLKEFFRHIPDQFIFATTRKPAMVHILNKLGFKEVGKTYNKDLRLLLYG